jgi:pilus assembly protein FimV
MFLPVFCAKNQLFKAASMNKHHGIRRAALSTAVALALGAISLGSAHAAGLGRLTVQSALGQPLRAEVEVTAVSKDEAGSLAAKLAPAEAFRQAGLELNPILSNLRFGIEKRGDRTFIKITSLQPVNEPFVDLMVELNWATGRFVREYTFLLDPPELRAAQREQIKGSDSVVIAPQVAAPPSAPVQASPLALDPPAAPAAVQQAQAPVAPSPRSRASAPAAPTAKAPSAQPVASATGDQYQVKRGDTLAAIARSKAGNGVALEQAIVSIYRSNPKAFFGDVNRLRAGSVLSMPEQSAMAAVDLAEARQQVKVRAGNFNQVKSRLAAKPKRLNVAKGTQSATGKVDVALEDTSGSKQAKDQLKLSKSSPGVAGTAGGTGNTSSKDAAAKAEQQVALQAALRESNSRVTDLEKNIAGLNSVLAMKDKQLADVTKNLDQARKDAKAAAKVEIPKLDLPKTDLAKSELPKLDLPKLDLPKADTSKADVLAKGDAKSGVAKLDPIKPDAGKTAAGTSIADTLSLPPLAGPSDAPKVDAPKIELAPVTPAPVAVAPKAPPKIRMPEPVPESSLMDTVMENLPLVGGGLGGLALLGGGAFWFMRRKKKSDSQSFDDSLVAAEAISPNSLFGTTGGQSVDTNNSLFAQNPDALTATGNSGAASSTEVDPIAEAEVYIAYGRESQAEDILKEALKRQPDRQQIRLKLAEIYAGRKDTGSLAAIAQEMHNSTGGQGDDWPRMVTLGLSVDSENPLYRGSESEAQAPAAQAFSAPQAPQSQAPRDLSGGTIASAMGVAGAAGLAAFGSGLGSPAKAAPVLHDEPMAIDTLDFNLDIDTAIGKPANAPAVQSMGQAMASAPKIDLDFNLPSLNSSVSTKAANALAVEDETDFRLDLPALEGLSIIGKGGSGTGNSALMNSASSLVDLSSINLELPGGTAIAEPAVETATDSAQRGRWQEMATKLDLASAYEEIGDKEGARELLDEVIKGGDGSQQQRARAMLTKLG